MSLENEVEGHSSGARLRLFSLNLDLAAGLRARRVSHQLAALAGADWRVSSAAWNRESLKAADEIRRQIARDVAAADVLILAASSLDRREEELIRWLDSLIAGAPGRRPACARAG